MDNADLKLKPYKEWIKSNNFFGSDSYSEYLKYVEAWFSDNFNKSDPSTYTPTEYALFLRQLKIIIDDPEMREYIDGIDWEDQYQVSESIILFAKKLKDKSKEASLNRGDAAYSYQLYKIYGTAKSYEASIKKSIIEYLILNNIEYSLSDLKDMSIWIECLYDDTEYHDKDPDVPADVYFDKIKDEDKKIVEFGFMGTYPVSSAEVSAFLNHQDGKTVFDYSSTAYETFLGESHYNVLSGHGYTTTLNALYPWRNTTNRYYPTIAIIEVPSLLYTAFSYGDYQLPTNLGMPIAIGKEKYFDKKDGGSEDEEPSLNPYLFSSGYSFTKKYQVTQIPYNSYLNWIDVLNASKESKGVIKIGDNAYQSMIPYHTSNELGNMESVGITTPQSIYDPWYFTEDNVWNMHSDELPEFRGIYSVSKWEESHNIISGDQIYWGIDVYGVNYALYSLSGSSGVIERKEISDGVIYLRTLNNIVHRFDTYYDTNTNASLSALDFDAISEFKVCGDMLFIKDANNIALQKITIDDESFVLNQKNSALITGEQYSGMLYDVVKGLIFIATTIENEIGNPLLKIYSFDGNLKLVYNMAIDQSKEIEWYKNLEMQALINKYPQFIYSRETNSYYWAFSFYNNIGMWMVFIQYKYRNARFYCADTIFVEPEEYGVEITPRESEKRMFIDLNIDYDKLIMVFKGIDTNNKYIQVLEL